MSAPLRWLRTVGALTPPVALATAAAVVGLYLFRRLIPIETFRASNNEVGNYLQTLGTVYAVLLAFVVFVVWNQFNETRTLVEREANELLDLWRTVRGFSTDEREPILRELHAYACDVIDREWSAMSCRVDPVLEEVGHRLDAIWNLIVVLEPCTECHRSLFSEILVRFNDLSDCRTGRLSSSRMRIPLALNILLYFGAFITVASMYLLAIDSFAIHAIATGALAGAISHVLYIVSDLDNPFAGDWQVPRAAFERVRRIMES